MHLPDWNASQIFYASGLTGVILGILMAVCGFFIPKYRILERALKIAGLLVAVCGFLIFIFGNRKEALQSAKERLEHERLAASIPKPFETGIVVLEVRDQYAAKTLSGATCTTDDGQLVLPQIPRKLPVGKLHIKCTHAGYFPSRTPVPAEVRTGVTTTVSVAMEALTGGVSITLVDSNGDEPPPVTPVMVNGRQHPGRGSPRVMRDLPARKVAQVTSPGTAVSWTKGNVEEFQSWGAASAEVKVKGGTDVPLKLVFPGPVHRR